VKRGEIWTVAGASDYVGKPRPAVVVQSDAFEGTESITICPFTTRTTHAAYLRLLLEPTELNGLATSSSMMIDKISTVSKSKLGIKIGRLADEDIARLHVALVVFLGLADQPRRIRP